MFTLKMSKHIAQNAPKFSRIVEPFGSYGSICFENTMRKPKEHIVNVEYVIVFSLLSFLKNITSSDKKDLRSRDWVGSEVAFNTVSSITATDGIDFYYKYMYVREFGNMAMKGSAPMFDWTMAGEDIKNNLFDIQMQALSLKKITLTNENYSVALNGSMGVDTFVILTPKTPEEIAACESKLPSLSNPFFFSKKSKSIDDLLQAVNGTELKVTDR